MEIPCDCGGNCACNRENSISEHFESLENNSSAEKIKKLKQAIAEIGFSVEETEEGIRIS